METTVTIPVSVLKSMQGLLEHGTKSGATASWVCGAIYVSIDKIIKEAELNETV